MLYRVYVTGWNDVWDMVGWLGAAFVMTGRNRYDDPVFDCGVFHDEDLHSLFTGFRCHIGSVELIEVWEA
jgi:hypothetical protein